MKHSPKVVTGTIVMDFSEAAKELLKGRKITKLEWADKNYYGYLKDGILTLHKPDNRVFQWVISEGDLIGKDYIILPDPEVN